MIPPLALSTLLKIIVFQTVIFKLTDAIPINFSSTPTTSSSSASYVPSPNGRGTADIILSSIITLTLCVYTSIHLNIAPNSNLFSIFGFGIKRATVYQFYWVITALIAPEFVLFASFNQWKTARRLFPEILQPTITVSSDIKNWSHTTMTSAFFVVMGGVAYRRGTDFGIPEAALKFPNLILTPECFLELATRKMIHPGILDTRSITERSKADALAKFLICVQALWMAINVVARKAGGLPSTLIELNVVVHVVVTVVVYGMWWYKPLGVQNPIIL
ncbi:hypothetical protein FPQ18DRAFT_260286, partial [Pyronema domesticum]